MAVVLAGQKEIFILRVCVPRHKQQKMQNPLRDERIERPSYCSLDPFFPWSTMTRGVASG